MTLTLQAQPYNISASGFYFEVVVVFKIEARGRNVIGLCKERNGHSCFLSMGKGLRLQPLPLGESGGANGKENRRRAQRSEPRETVYFV